MVVAWYCLFQTTFGCHVKVIRVAMELPNHFYSTVHALAPPPPPVPPMVFPGCPCLSSPGPTVGKRLQNAEQEKHLISPRAEDDKDFLLLV